MSAAFKKKTARSAAQGILSVLDKDRRRRAAGAAGENLKTAVYWRKAGSVLAYLAFGSELDADPLIQAALDEGKSVYVPRVIGSRMDFHRITSLEGPFEKGIFGIREPSPKLEAWDSVSSPKPALVLVPGLAFDKKGARLGRGGGYYDKFISGIRREAWNTGNRAPLFIGFAYSEQIFAEIPSDDNDEIIDGLVTDGFCGLF